MTTSNSDQPSSILTTLESAANQILAAVAPTTSRLVHVTVEIRDQSETAATDGTVLIHMPTTFCDVKVAEEVKVAVGLLVHEVGHFLQPLEAVDAVEAEERIPHWLSNVVLDIQGEFLLQSLFPTFKRPLAEVRRTVKRKQLGVYEAEIGNAGHFAQAAGSLALWGRFAKPILPFYAESLPYGTPEENRAMHFMGTLDAFRSCPAKQLPQQLARLINEFPELRQSPVPAFPEGMEGVQGQVTGALGRTLRREAGQHTAELAGGGDNAEIQMHIARPDPPSPEAVTLARTIRPRFLSAKGGVQVLAPGRFDRRSAARGEIPLRMALPGRDVPAPRLVLCLDASGSMDAPSPGCDGRAKWQVAQIAAQAVALSVQSAGGQVVGIVFGDGAWMTNSGDAVLFTLPQKRHKVYVGSGTCFRFLVELWRRYPDHQVLVLTDGSGTAPDGILPGDRQRTSAVIIPRGDAARASAWSERQVVLQDLRHLAAVLAMLVPRAKLG